VRGPARAVLVQATVKGTPEERAKVVRPCGWQAPGPKPAGDGGDPSLVPTEEESLSFLTGDFRIFQMKNGHRWSADDFLTAHEALIEAEARGVENVQHALDLGCGVGSVLMMVAWGLPHAKLLGVEAQEVSFNMLVRSLRYNGLESRVRAKLGDMRDVRDTADRAPLENEGLFDLITGTPPYFPVGAGVFSEKVQRGPCFFETRGGIEAYCDAAGRVLSPDGVFVVCESAFARKRVPSAFANAGLILRRSVEVIPRDEKPPLFDIYIGGKNSDAAAVNNKEAGSGQARPVSTSRFMIRDRHGAITEQMHKARERMGLPPTKHLEKSKTGT
jgi:tRNA1Val (adenine37-N6)-methyltransferase